MWPIFSLGDPCKWISGIFGENLAINLQDIWKYPIGTPCWCQLIKLSADSFWLTIDGEL